MEITLFILLNIVAVFLLFYGYYTKNDLPRIYSTTILFLLGVSLSPFIPSNIGGLDIIIGENETIYYVYGDNLTSGDHWDLHSGTPPNLPSSSFLILEEFNSRANIYETYQSHTLSFLYMAFGGLLLISILGDRRAYDNEL